MNDNVGFFWGQFLSQTVSSMFSRMSDFAGGRLYLYLKAKHVNIISLWISYPSERDIVRISNLVSSHVRTRNSKHLMALPLKKLIYLASTGSKFSEKFFFRLYIPHICPPLNQGEVVHIVWILIEVSCHVYKPMFSILAIPGPKLCIKQLS